MINAIFFYRIEHWLYKKKIPFLPKVVKFLIFLLYNSSIPYQCSIGKGTKFSYGGISVVVHKRTVIGNNCIIGSCVTLGGRSGIFEVPIVGDNVYLGTGSKLIGNITIGNNVTIGANAVVLNDIPDNAVVVGIPAKIIKYNSKKNN